MKFLCDMLNKERGLKHRWKEDFLEKYYFEKEWKESYYSKKTNQQFWF